jgi:hypothetical protein
MINPKRWPVIRHARALGLIFCYAYKASVIWHVTSTEQLDVTGFYRKDREHARRVWMGLE